MYGLICLATKLKKQIILQTIYFKNITRLSRKQKLKIVMFINNLMNPLVVDNSEHKIILEYIKDQLAPLSLIT